MSDDDKFKAIEGRLIELSGEVFAARTIAFIALDWLTALTPPDTRRETFTNLQAAVDKALSGLVHIGGDEAANERMKEIARERADAALAAIQRART